jgi:hypothetical protein
LGGTIRITSRFGGDKLYGCRLGTNWIKQHACIVTNVHFENTVVKLQRDQHDTLTLDEMEAAKCLLQEDLDDNQSYSSGDEGDNDEIVMSLCTCAEANKQRQLSMQQKTESPYVDCSYILELVAEVERLWTLPKYIIK